MIALAQTGNLRRAIGAADLTKAYNQGDATGFIRLNGPRLKVAAQVHGKG